MNHLILRKIKDNLAIRKCDVDKLINEISGTDKNGRSTYIKEFLKEYKSYSKISSLQILYQTCSKANIIWVGDYHANPASQKFLIQLLEVLNDRNKPIILGVEMLYRKNQRVLEEWLGGIVSEKEFLKRIRYDLEWGYDWENYREIFLRARSYNIGVQALDCELRDDLRKIHKRDLCVATKIVSLIEQNPQVQLIIFFGESHLARKHLPGKVRKALVDLGKYIEDVVIVQNLDSIYWALLRDNVQADVVEIERGKFCVMNSTPLEKYSFYKQAILRWKHQE